MRILLASVDFVPHRDGVSTLSYHYARRLAERGHDVIVVGPKARGDKESDARAPYRAYRFVGYSLGWFRFFPFCICSLAAFIKHRPDVVFPMNIGYGGILFYVLSLFGLCRYVTTAYAFEFLKFREHTLLYPLYKRIYARSEFTVAISNFTKQALVSFGVDPERIRISYPGIEPSEAQLDAPLLPAAARSNGSMYMGTCGRLIRRKGHDIVLKALAEVRRTVPDVNYLIAGRGPEEARLRQLRDELGLQDHVTFLGQLEMHELASFYRTIDLFVMPSRAEESSGHAEGFGIVYLEAALYDKPSLATKTGGIPEAVVDGRTGLLVEPESVDALAAAMKKLLDDPKEMRKLGAQARERACAELTWDCQVDKIDAWLNELESP